MPLNFSVANVNNYHENFPAPKDDRHQWNYITEALVMVMMVIGMQRIDDKNIDEYWTRLEMYQRCVGPLLHTVGEEKLEARFITRKEVEQHIGLTTNCSTLTATQFDKQFMRILREQHKA